MPLHKFLKEHQSWVAIAAFRNIDFQELALMINSSPQIVCFTIDLYEDLVKMPSPVGMILGRLKSFLPDLAHEHWAKFIIPITDCFMKDINAPVHEANLQHCEVKVET